MKVLIVGGNSSLSVALKPVLDSHFEIVTAGRHNCDWFIDMNDTEDKINYPTDTEVVIHCAAHFGGASNKEIIEAETVNVLGTLKLCQAAVRHGVKHFIFISSIFSQLKNDSKFYNIYSISKKHAEEIAVYYMSAHSITLTVLRASQFYGNSDIFRPHQPFFYSILDRTEKCEEVVFYGKNDAQRNFIHIHDMAWIILRVIQTKTSGVFSCQHICNVKYSQIALAAIVAFKSSSVIRFDHTKPDILDNVFPIDDSLYKAIGYYPSISIDEGIKGIAKNNTKHL